jgi:2,3-dihydroxybiphenyl 1,2-dioxygenase
MTGMCVGYIGIDVADRASVDAYLAEIVGFVRADVAPPESSAWRLDDRAARVFIHDGDHTAVRYVGLLAADRRAYDTALERLAGGGVTAVEGSVAEAHDRRVASFVHVQAPWGSRIEIAHGHDQAERPYFSPLVPGGFLTGELGMGHVVFVIPGGPQAFEQATTFCEQPLGFVLTDYLEIDMDGPVRGNFYHLNPRHHSMALVSTPAPPGPAELHHLMFECVDVDDVRAAFDRAVAAGVPIPNGLGKHDNDRMFSFYSQSPAGFLVEVGFGAVEVHDPFPVNRYERISAWGHQPFAPTAPG